MRKTAKKVKKLAPKLFQAGVPFHFSTLVHAPEMTSVVGEIQHALDLGIAPVRNAMATGDVFEMHDRFGEKIAIFKPNSDWDKQMILREYAAYRLDHHRFAKVPPTVLATFTHSMVGVKRHGACQLYVRDCQPAVYADVELVDALPDEAIRRIAILDIRLINCDRHTSNLLVSEGNIYPIDHGATLPSYSLGPHFVWSRWKQAESPFSKEEMEYIGQLDPKTDHHFLIEELAVNETSADWMYAATELLKRGAKAHLTPAEIAALMLDQKLFTLLFESLPPSKEVGWTRFSKNVIKNIKEVLSHAPR